MTPNRQTAAQSKQGHIRSVQFSCSVVSDSLQPHGLQHARLPCPSPTHGVYSKSCCLLNSILLFILCGPLLSSCLQSFPASGSFPMCQLFTAGGQSIGVSPSKISPSNEYSGLISFRMDWLDLLAVQGTQESSPTPQFKSINSSL